MTEEEMREEINGKGTHAPNVWYYTHNFRLSEKFISDFKDKVDWIFISTNYTLTESFIEKFENYVDWVSISLYQKLSENFILKHKNQLHWEAIFSHQKLSENFIREFQHMIGVNWVFKSQKLSEDFIREFKDRNINWYFISEYQKLSESFIREFKDKVDWYRISRYQNLSKKFILEFEDKINLYGLICNKHNWFNYSYKTGTNANIDEFLNTDINYDKLSKLVTGLIVNELREDMKVIEGKECKVKDIIDMIAKNEINLDWDYITIYSTKYLKRE